MNQALTETDSESNSAGTPEGFKARRPGTVTYRDALSFQDNLDQTHDNWPVDLLILLEQPAVIAPGRNQEPTRLLRTEVALARTGTDDLRALR